MSRRANPRALASRLLLLALAAACAAAGVLALRGDDRCASAADRALALSPATAAATAPAVARDTLDACAGAAQAVPVMVRLAGAGRRTEAVALAVGYTRRAPEDYLGWLALARLDRDPARARAALLRARALNPRGVDAPR